MKRKQIEITIETAERWYKEGNLEMKQLALEAFPELEKKLPKSWKELKEITGYYIGSDANIFLCERAESIVQNQNLFATRKQAEASIALAQLSQLREAYRKGWIPDWNNKNQEKHCIIFYKNATYSVVYFATSSFLSFQDEETSDLFLENFHELIEIAKPLLS